MEMCISYLDTQSAYVPNHELMFVGQLMKDRNVTMQFSITATVQYIHVLPCWQNGSTFVPSTCYTFLHKI